jgi:large subunit ribosomal protein L17
MRHKKKNNHLSRKTAHRSAMFSNMAISLIMHKRIFTTVPKAKALRKYVEPLINRSKDDTTSSRRLVFSHLQNKEAITELFQNVAQKVADRPGGYTRIIKTGYRLGDNAAMCFIELVDYNENMLSDGGAKKAKTTRRSRRKATGTATAAIPEATPKTEEVIVAEAAVETESDTTEVAEATPKAKKAEKVKETEEQAAEETATAEVTEEATETPKEPESEETK